MKKNLLLFTFLLLGSAFVNKISAQYYITVCGTVSNTGGQSVNVTVIDSMSGVWVTIPTDTSGNYCDTLNAPNPQGMIIVSIVNCYNQQISNGFFYSPGASAINANFVYCNFFPTSVLVCYNILNTTPGTPVQIILGTDINGVLTFDTTTIVAMGSSISNCDTLVWPMSTGSVSLQVLDCNGVYQTVTSIVNPGNANIYFTLNYCNPQTNCWAFWTSTYDQNLNSFFISVDSLTANNAVSYFWDFGDSTTSTLQYPSHTYANLGLYNVCLYIITSTGDTCSYCHTIGIWGGVVYTKMQSGFTVNVVPSGPTSVKENILENVSVYPNPATDNLLISIPALNANRVTATLINLTGSTIKQVEQSATESRIKFDLNEVPSGIYMLQLKVNNQVKNFKVVKK